MINLQQHNYKVKNNSSSRNSNILTSTGYEYQNYGTGNQNMRTTNSSFFNKTNY